jgi:transcriptional regulator with PAS, ATPase and Fis domain
LENLISLIIQRLTGKSLPAIVKIAHDIVIKSLGKEYAWPGNVRELEQAVRCILLTRQYHGDRRAVAPDLCSELQAGIANGTLEADRLLSGYCSLLYERHGTYEKVAERTNLDRRTAKAYIGKSRKRTSEAP